MLLPSGLLDSGAVVCVAHHTEVNPSKKQDETPEAPKGRMIQPPPSQVSTMVLSAIHGYLGKTDVFQSVEEFMAKLQSQHETTGHALLTISESSALPLAISNIKGMTGGFSLMSPVITNTTSFLL